MSWLRRQNNRQSSHRVKMLTLRKRARKMIKSLQSKRTHLRGRSQTSLRIEAQRKKQRKHQSSHCAKENTRLLKSSKVSPRPKSLRRLLRSKLKSGKSRPKMRLLARCKRRRNGTLKLRESASNLNVTS